ncbi:MAG: hypothetical protein WC551_09950 [Patescibacteria group bacterium]
MDGNLAAGISAASVIVVTAGAGWKIRDWIGKGFESVNTRLTSMEVKIDAMQANCTRQKEDCGKRFERDERLLNGRSER